jgi:BirA family biotin operon repressor/biotin-[acetyl-CoA-carboxylase] ligase
LSLINTLFLGNVVVDFPEIGSTNDYATEWLSKTRPAEGTVVTAGYQWAGRGQIGSTWAAEARQNLLMSVILYPSFLQARLQFRLNMALALATAEAADALTGLRTQVKWPNDIYLHNRKVAGLLLQNSLSGALLQWTVAGLGLNVNQRVFDAALPRAYSLALATGRNYELDDVLAAVCQAMERRYLQLRAGEAMLIERDYLSRLYRLGEDALYRRPEGPVFSGRIVGIDQQGKLRLLHAGGEESFGLKEVQFVDE